MLNFQPKKRAKGVGFTLDPVKREQAKAPATQRRHLHLIFLVGVAIITGVLMWSFIDKIRTSMTPVADQLNHEIPLTPMAKPSIATLPALPDAAAIAEHKSAVGEPNAGVPLWIEQPDAPTLAWIDVVLTRDRSVPPLPQRIEARDLALRHVKVGENIVVTGLLEDSQPAPVAGAANGYQRLLVALPDQQYVEVLAPEAARDLVIGDQVTVVGRYLGSAILPPSDNQPEVAAPPTAMGAKPTASPAAPARIEVPMIAARLASKPAQTRERDNPYVMRGEWRLPEDVFNNIDDDLLVIETRPYYYTLGQVALDRTTPGVFNDAKRANELGSQIHREPSKFRGQQFTVTGHVFHAWEDPGVAQDQPFGVDRVVRIIMWSEDWGDWELNDNGVVKTTRKLILRAFELAAITHEPVPQPGDIISATGRFLRLRSMEVKPNEARDRRMGIQRQSDRAHTFFFVTDGFTFLPPPAHYDLSGFGWVIFVVVVLTGLVMLRIARRDASKEDKVSESVRRLRATRHALANKQTSPAASVPTDATASPPASSVPGNGDPPSD